MQFPVLFCALIFQLISDTSCPFVFPAYVIAYPILISFTDKVDAVFWYYEKIIFDFHILTPTLFPCCVPFGFHNWSFSSRRSSLTLRVRFFSKFTQRLIIRAVIQWFCVKKSKSIRSICYLLLMLRIHGDKMILPFFFESTDFFFAALRGSLSEPSSVFKSKSYKLQKNYSHPLQTKLRKHSWNMIDDMCYYIHLLSFFLCH